PLAIGGAQVESHRLLIACKHRPPERGSLDPGLPPLAHGVAVFRILDLDDLGAQIAEDLPAERAGDELPHLDDSDASERSVAVGAWCFQVHCFSFEMRFCIQSSRSLM